jgi:hypothetical protein
LGLSGETLKLPRPCFSLFLHFLWCSETKTWYHGDTGLNFQNLYSELQYYVLLHFFWYSSDVYHRLGQCWPAHQYISVSRSFCEGGHQLIIIPSKINFTVLKCSRTEIFDYVVSRYLSIERSQNLPIIIIQHKKLIQLLITSVTASLGSSLNSHMSGINLKSSGLDKNSRALHSL